MKTNLHGEGLNMRYRWAQRTKTGIIWEIELNLLIRLAVKKRIKGMNQS